MLHSVCTLYIDKVRAIKGEIVIKKDYIWEAIKINLFNMILTHDHAQLDVKLFCRSTSKVVILMSEASQKVLS